jgi:2-desacetyl-2-hydroxyethyl bacteriochlorophyllide A dehydrogenase
MADPVPGRGEALIRMTAAGICGTDLEIARGYLDFRGVPGHEFVGVVTEAPEPGWVGSRVVGEINIPCRSCEACSKGLLRHCPDRTVLGIAGRDGAFAELLTLPVSNLHRVPDRIPDEAAIFTEPLAAAHEILEQVPVPERSRTLVVGDGRLGQLCAHVLARAGSPPVVCGRHPEKLKRLSFFGFQTMTAETDFERRFDLVVEATGSPGGLETALRAARPRGTVVLKSTYHGEAALALAGVVIDEITLVGSRCGPFEAALEHLSSDTSITDHLITARYCLDDVGDAFERATQPASLKVLLHP